MSNLPQQPDGPAPLRAAIYTRVSTEDQATEGHSLSEQERRGLELIDRERWRHAGTFTDAGVSGALASRPDLDRLMEAVAAGRIDCVIVYALDRLARDAGVLRDILRVVDAAGVRIVAAGQALDRTTPEGRLQTGILGEFAQYEKDKIKARAKIGIDGRARSGKPWGAPKWPYRKGADGEWEPDPAAVAIMRRIFRERVEDGRTLNRISARLNAEGIPGANGGNWTATTVKKVLTGRHVLGYFNHGGEWIKGTHPPVIDEETWEAAQALTAQGDKYAPSRGGRLPKLHLFSGGILRCAECLESMVPRTDGDKYVCRTNKYLKGAGSCPMPSWRREDVDRQALALFQRHFLDLDATRARVAADLDDHLATVEAQHHRAAREAAEKATQLDRVEGDYLAGNLTGASYERLMERLAAERAAAEAERDRLAGNAEAVRQSRADLDAEGDVLRRLCVLRESVVSRVRTAEDQQDVESLRAAIAQAFGTVWLDSTSGALTIDFAAAVNEGRVGVPFEPRHTCSGSGVPE